MTRSSTNDRLENIRFLVKFSKDVVDTTKIPFLSTAFAILSNILDTVQRVRRLKDDFHELVERAANVLTTVWAQLENDAHVTRSITFETNSKLLVDTVKHIQNTVQDTCSMSKMARLLKMDSLETNIKECRRRLEECLTLFQVTSVIEIQDLLGVLRTQHHDERRELSHLITGLENSSAERHAGVIQGQELIVAALNKLLAKASADVQPNNDIRVLPSGEVITDDTFMTTSQGHRLYYAEWQGRRVQAVIVKCYVGRTDAQKAFVRDLSLWREQTSPHLMQLIGRSSKEVESPYLVFTGVIRQNVRSFMRTKYNHNPVTGFISTLKMIEGLASACEYLGNIRLVSTEDLSQCTKLSNLMLNPEGKLLVGRNMLETVSESTATSSQTPTDMWMKDHLSKGVVELIFGVPLTFTDWQEAGGLTSTGMPHLRTLLKYTAFYANYPMVDLTKNLRELYQQLQDQELELGVLTFRQIRAIMLQSPPVINHNHVFRPLTHVDVALGDLGYIDTRNGTPVFVKLCNFLHELGHEVYHEPLEVVSASPDPHWKMHENPDGSRCYTFKRPQYIHIRRLRSSTFLQDHKRAWQFLIDKAPMLEETFCKERGLTLHQLILVVGIEEELRRTYLEACRDLKQLDAIEVVHFHEDSIPTSTAWGHWSLSSDPLENDFSSDHFSIKFTRSPQNIAFAQLEDGDW